MRALLRIALLLIIGFLLLAVVIAVGRGDSGAVETIALVAAAVLLVLAAAFVSRRLA
jgi:Kef-type K+ transport system membrane component KefB